MASYGYTIQNPSAEVDDAEAFQKWLGTQQLAQQQAAAPAAASQPQMAPPTEALAAPSTATPPAPSSQGQMPFVVPAPPPPPPPLPVPTISATPPVGAAVRVPGDDLDTVRWVNGPAAANGPDPITPPRDPGDKPPVNTGEYNPDLDPDGDAVDAFGNVSGRGPNDPAAGYGTPDSPNQRRYGEGTAPPATGTGTGAGSGGGTATTTGAGTAPASGGGGTGAASAAAEGWLGEFRTWVRDIMKSPSRYSSDLVKQGQAVIEDGINRMRDNGRRQIAEGFAERGLSGSTEETTTLANFEAQLQEQGRKQMFELGREQAMTWAQDLGLAGSLGLGVGNQLNDRESMLLMDLRQRMSLELQKQGLDQATADRRADRELQRELAEAQREWEREKWREYTQLEYGGEDDEDGGSGATPGAGGMSSDIINYQGIAAGQHTLSMRQQRWDAFVAKYGQQAALQNLGSRPLW